MKKLLFLTMALLSAVPAISQSRKTKNVVIITFDGLRWKDMFRGADSTLFYNKLYVSQKEKPLAEKYWANTPQERREKLMPFFWSTIAKNGQVFGNRDIGNRVEVKNRYWFSYPGYNEMFTGYPDTAVNSNAYPPNPNVTVQEFISKQPGYKGKVAAFTSWSAFNRILNKERCGFLINAGYENMPPSKVSSIQTALDEAQHLLPKIFGLDERPDAVTYARVSQYLKQEHPRVLQFSMIDTDAWGHQGKYDFYLDAARNSDAMIEGIWKMLQEDPFYKDQTTLYITVDHGRGDGDAWKNHGAKVEHSNETWFAVMGPDTKPLGEQKNSDPHFQYQHAKTIAALLGLDFTGPQPKGPIVQSVVSGK